MIKKIDKLIIKAFIGPFIAVFFITLLVLVIQFFWLYVDDFVGKGLEPFIIFEFIWYKSTELVPLALPLAVLLSSLMTFGNLGETYELVAIKSSGISLLRFMQPLLIITFIISIGAFFFSNHVIPVANLKSRTLLTDIVYAKPSFDIKEGTFYDKIPGFAIKIGKKEKNDTVIRNIIIYEQNNNVQDNFIIAANGVMRISDNKRYLEFHLKNGWRYEERLNHSTQVTDYIRLGFKEYKKSFDLSSFGFQQRTADSLNKNNAKMMTMRQLNVAMDSNAVIRKRFGENIKNEVLTPIVAIRHLDSTGKKDSSRIEAKNNFNAHIPDSIKSVIQQRVNDKVASIRSQNEVLLYQYKDALEKLYNLQIEWHRKISLAGACMVLFLIGAPLGSIIRKGGLGSPVIFAIIFFMVFYFTSTTGEKLAREGTWNAVFGMWFSTLLLLPIGIFLTYKAMHDSQLFNKEVYSRFIKKLPFFKKK